MEIQRDNSLGDLLRKVFTCRNVAILVLYGCLIAMIAFLISQGLVDDLAEKVEDRGFVGYLVFTALLVIVTQPYGWGYSVVEISLGFIYGWYGLIILQVGAQIGSLIAFISVRKFQGSRFCGSSDLMEDEKIKILTQNLNDLTTGKRRKTYPIMIFSRQSPLPFGIVTTLLALTNVSMLDFYVTLVLGVFFEGPLNINLGVLLRQLEDVGNDELLNETVVGQDGDVDEIENNEATVRNVQTYISLSITLVFLVLFSCYGKIIWKKMNKPHSKISTQVEIASASQDDTEDLQASPNPPSPGNQSVPRPFLSSMSLQTTL